MAAAAVAVFATRQFAAPAAESVAEAPAIVADAGDPTATAAAALVADACVVGADVASAHAW